MRINLGDKVQILHKSVGVGLNESQFKAGDTGYVVDIAKYNPSNPIFMVIEKKEDVYIVSDEPDGMFGECFSKEDVYPLEEVVQNEVKLPISIYKIIVDVNKKYDNTYERFKKIAESEEVARYMLSSEMATKNIFNAIEELAIPVCDNEEELMELMLEETAVQSFEERSARGVFTHYNSFKQGFHSAIQLIADGEENINSYVEHKKKQ